MKKNNCNPENEDKMDRRNFLKKSILGATALSIGANLTIGEKSNAEVSKLNFNTRSVMLREGDVPNILMIMADQWRWDYIGCAGADFLNTPISKAWFERLDQIFSAKNFFLLSSISFLLSSLK